MEPRISIRGFVIIELLWQHNWFGFLTQVKFISQPPAGLYVKIVKLLSIQFQYIYQSINAT